MFLDLLVADATELAPAAVAAAAVVVAAVDSLGLLQWHHSVRLAAIVLGDGLDRCEHWAGKRSYARRRTVGERTEGDTCSAEPLLQSDRSKEGWGNSRRLVPDVGLEHQLQSLRS